MKVPSGDVNAVAFYAYCEPDEAMPLKDVIRTGQQEDLRAAGVIVGESTSFTTPVGRVSLDEEGLFSILVNAKAVLWIPSRAMDLKVRLMVRVHTKEAGYRGVAANLQ